MSEDPLGRMLELWRSMGSPPPPDAWRLPGVTGLDPSVPAADWRDGWLTATTWWADAMAGRRAAPGASARLLTEVVEGLARAFRGRRFAFELAGRRLQAKLEWILLDRREGHYAGWLELADIDWGGLRFERLRVAVGSIALTGPPEVTVTALDVELDGRSPLGPLVTWLDGRLQRWHLTVTSDGLVEAVPAAGSLRFVVDPAVREGTADIDLRRVTWRSVQLRLPTWLRLTRQLALPPLPSSLTVCDARLRGSVVDSRLVLPAVSRRLDLGTLREAIAGATAGQRTTR